LLERLIGVNMQISLELKAPLAAVWADQGQLEQALMNLVSNARDAMSRKGIIRIVTRTIPLERSHHWLPAGQKPGFYTQLTVIDHGCGMDEATQKRIFEPFFTTKTSGQGTGLGMSIVQHIVTAAQGFVRLESECQRGTAVHLFFPFQAIQVPMTPELPTPRSALRSSPPSQKSPARGTGQRILLVEDNTELRTTTARLLQHMGYVVEMAESPEVALNKLESGLSFDLLLTDVSLPGMNGPELAQRLLERLPGCAVLFMSGLAPEAALQQRLPIVMKNFLQKPFAPHDLLVAIRGRLQEPK
jgi:CheY-like chemotaxis protein